ncbi:MAG: hypothetical protein ACK5EW_06805 [Bacteroidota bacterium]|jgi:hypothetical protein
MGLIKEPLDVDFLVDSRTLTPAEEKAISAFIKADKAKRKAKSNKSPKTSSKKQSV